MEKDQIKNINYNEATIQQVVKGEKYSNEIKISWLIECEATNDKYSINNERMIELVESDPIKKEECTLLVRNGYPSNGDKIPAGAGIAVKVEKVENNYNLTFFESEIGKPFDANKIQNKSFLKLNKDHFESVITFIKLDKEVKDEKAKKLKEQRTSLVLK